MRVDIAADAHHWRDANDARTEQNRNPASSACHGLYALLPSPTLILARMQTARQALELILGKLIGHSVGLSLKVKREIYDRREIQGSLSRQAPLHTYHPIVRTDPPRTNNFPPCSGRHGREI